VFDEEFNLHLKAVGCSLVTLAQHRDFVKGLQETGCVLESLPLVTAQLEHLKLGVAIYHPGNGVATFKCVSKQHIPSVPSGFTR
jgi:hypothetical protein